MTCEIVSRPCSRNCFAIFSNSRAARTLRNFRQASRPSSANVVLVTMTPLLLAPMLRGEVLLFDVDCDRFHKSHCLKLGSATDRQLCQEISESRTIPRYRPSTHPREPIHCLPTMNAHMPLCGCTSAEAWVTFGTGASGQ